MRPLKLEMSAFGPYRDTEIIKFDELQNAKLFLVTGKTGSGKTTIFDAICYAIYGEASGNIRNVDDFRSQFARKEVLTQVLFEFELNSVQYKVKRIPKQIKPKERGEGMTVKNAEAELVYINSNKEKKVITGITDVNNHIESKMGINAKQFRQIMMIPQGEFRELLLSDSQEREKVLQKLFDTSIYQMIQEKLSIKAKSLRDDIEKKNTFLQNDIRRIEAIDGKELYELIKNKDMNIEKILSMTNELIKDDEKNLLKLKGRIEDKQKEIESIITKKSNAISQNEALEKMEIIKSKFNNLKNKKKDIDKEEKKYNTALKAKGIEHEYKAYIESINEQEKRDKNLDTISKKMFQIETNLKESKEYYDIEFNDKKEEELIKLQNKKEEFEKLKDDIENLKEAKNGVKKINEKEKNTKQKIEKLEKRKKELNQSIKDFEKNIEDINKAKTELYEIKEDLSTYINKNKVLDDLVDVIEKWKNKLKESMKIKETIKEYKIKVLEAKKEEEKKESEYYSNQALMLADKLQDNEACPVCGSKDHPNKKTTSKEETTFLEFMKSKENHKKLKEKLDKKTNELEKIEYIIDDLKDKFINNIIETKINLEVKDDFDKKLNTVKSIKSEADKKIKEFEDKKKKAEKIIKTEEDRIKNLKKLKKELDINNKEVQDYTIEIGKISVEQGKLNERIKILEKRIPKEIKSIKDYERKLINIQNKIKDTKNKRNRIKEKYLEYKQIYDKQESKLDSARKEFINAKTKKDKKEKMFKEAYKKQGFIDQLDYESALWDDEKIEAIKEMIKEFEKNYQETKTTYERLKKETKKYVIKDIKEFDNMKEKIQKLKADLSKEESNIYQRKKNNERIIKEADEYLSQINVLKEKYSYIGDLSNVANGNNQARITFERYVLASFFEDILNAANQRLRIMSQNRYKLSRTDEKQRANKQSGLEIEVFDSHTGKYRHVKTLSGGESFQASLSMALGLADVVQSYAGGIKIDTIFIDEGFGSLDVESLDSAISTLIQIQKSGRLVGIISHVEALKERIKSQLLVETGPDGSNTKFVMAK